MLISLSHLIDLGEAVVVLLQRVREARELLPERHRHRVLQLRAPDLQDVRELAALRRERLGEQRVLVEQALHAEHHRELDRGRVHVVRRLAAVDVVDRVQLGVVAELLAHRLEARVGDDLVGVHVGAGARTALDDADHELVVQLAGDDALADVVDDLSPWPGRARRSRGSRARRPA